MRPTRALINRSPTLAAEVGYELVLLPPGCINFAASARLLVCLQRAAGVAGEQGIARLMTRSVRARVQFVPKPSE